MRLIAITDGRYEADHMQRVAAVFAARFGARFAVQLRGHPSEFDASAWERFALRLRDTVRPFGAKLILNRDVELASRIDADGVHADPRPELLPQGFEIRSAPTHELVQVARARACAATMILVSPIFSVPGKGLARGVGAIVEARAHFDGQVIALGGVTPQNLAPCLQAGADGIAAIRAVWEQPRELEHALLRVV
jgi:thiamine monophosphate synthase